MDSEYRARTSATQDGRVGAVIVLGLTGVRALLWLFYRPRVAPAGAELPRLTVVIPAYNEGPRVRRARGLGARAFKRT